MKLSLFSFLMAVLWNSIFFLVGYVLQRRKTVFVVFYFIPLLLVSILSVLRLFVPVEFAFAKVVHSRIILPKMIRFLNIPLLTIWDITITVNFLFLLIWAFGTIFLLAKTMVQVIHFKKLCNSISPESELFNHRISFLMDKIVGTKCWNKKVNVIQTSFVNTPLLVGFFHCVIFLPYLPFTDLDLEYILRHELTHYRQKDLWIKLLLHLIYSILWWNPFLYFLRREVNHLLELKSDFSLARQLTEEERTEYLETILKVLEQQSKMKKNQNLSQVGIGFVSHKKRKKIKQRFEFINHYKPISWLQRFLNYALCLLLLLSFFCSFFFIVQPYAEPSSIQNDCDIFTINEDTSYLIANKDGSYSLYEDGVYLFDIQDKTIEPFSSFTVHSK